ncbi:MAG: PD-(D/E)XK nuclease family protein, partial [Planctomycetaceae bacterium]|nr:PD-(D/E)XK nuclease family protein [Planctomycetaceae bacterium]
SAQSVIDTVNAVFENIEENLLFQDKTKDGEKDEENNYIAAAKLWKGKGKKGFETHTTAKDFSGYCSLVLIPTADVPTEDEYEENYSDDENGEDSRKADKFIEDTAEKIKELHYAKPYAKIGVLVRRNRFITQFISALKAKNVEAKEEGGNPLPNDSAAVRVVLSALMLADHPGDTVARFHVADSPLAEHCGLTEYRKCIAERKLNDKNYLENDGKFAARNWSEKTRCKAATEGLGSVVKELAEVIRQKENLDADFPRESQWLEKLIELAFQFETEAKEDRLSRFVERVKVKGVSGKSDEGDITVTNIHKSKGLEYDIVVLPDLTCEFYYNTTDMIVSRKSPVEPVDFVVRYAFKALQRFLPKEYREAFDRRIRGEIVESLNLLYVAMTRAKRELMMLVPHKTADKNGNPAEDEHKRKTFGNLLLKGLSPEIEEYGNGGVFYAHGNADWYQEFEEELKKKQKYAKKEEPEQPIPAVFKLKTEPKKRSFLRLVPSGADKKAEPPTSETVKTEDTEEIQEVVHGSNNAMRRGTAIHKCFEFTLNRDPFLEHSIPGKGELLQNCQEDETKELDWDEIIESFTKMCGNANVRKALSRSAYPADETVVTEHERRFIVKVKDDDEDKIVNGTIDRLIIRRRGGKVVGVDIIDFKTGGRNDEFYEPQMQLYRQSAVELYRIDESDVTVKLLYVSLGEAVPV